MIENFDTTLFLHTGKQRSRYKEIIGLEAAIFPIGRAIKIANPQKLGRVRVGIIAVFDKETP